MRTYSVNWKIDIEAESPVEAARWALGIHRDPNSAATVFDVFDEHGNYTCVDLLGIEEARMGQTAGDRQVLIEPHKQSEIVITAKTSHWEDDPEFPAEDWGHEVTNGDTRLGYREWVEHQRDIKKKEQ